MVQIGFVGLFAVDSTQAYAGAVVDTKIFKILREQVGLNHRKLPEDFCFMGLMRERRAARQNWYTEWAYNH